MAGELTKAEGLVMSSSNFPTVLTGEYKYCLSSGDFKTGPDYTWRGFNEAWSLRIPEEFI